MEHPENDEPDHGEYEMGDLSIEEYNQERGYDQDDIGYISNSLNHVSNHHLSHHVFSGT